MTYTRRPLREEGRRRLDHHQPSRGPQRVPHDAPSHELTDAFLDARWDPRDRRRRAHRRRRQGLLLRRRPEGARAGRLLGRGGAASRPDGRRSAAQRDPPHPEAGDRDGERLRDRRRPRAARALRSLDRRRDTRSSARPGPRVGSVDAGHGTGYLARVVGEKKAREIWYLCRQYSRAGRARDGPRQQGGPAEGAARRGRAVVRASCSRRARRRSRSPSSRSTSTPSRALAWRSSRAPRSTSTTRPTRRWKDATRSSRSGRSISRSSENDKTGRTGRSGVVRLTPRPARSSRDRPSFFNDLSGLRHLAGGLPHRGT